MSATGATPEDLAKSLLIQSILSKKGLNSDDIAKALNQLSSMEDQGDQMSNLVKMVKEALKDEGITQTDITKAMTLAKAIEAGKVRGLKDIQDILDNSPLSSVKDIVDAISQSISSGALGSDAMKKTMILQKVMKAIGANPETVAKAIALQKNLAENGMSKHEIANAMSLALALGLDHSQNKSLIEAAFKDLILNGLCQDEIDSILALTKAIEDGAEIPPEAIRLLKKAMKQRRGSVENVAETLMATLAAGGESADIKLS